MLDSGKTLLAIAERRLGHLAIPGILRWIGAFQLLVWGLSNLDPHYLEYLLFDRSEILRGQVWRLFSFVFVPVNDSVIWVLVGTMFLWFISDSLENAWDSFRTNLFVLATVLCMAIAGLFPVPGLLSGFFAPFLFDSIMFLAFAALFPNQVIMLMLIIPVKAKWLGLANGALLLATAVAAPVLFLTIGCAMLPWLLVFLPGFFSDVRRSSDNATRRLAFQQSVKASDSDAFHTCEGCGKTDVSDPDLEFRVTASGEELCADCIATRTGGEAPSS
ncbi:MAG: hypothetical protein H7A53_08455 [Akkermansiaceae bacterium]|nr:hypothetical protein [Akkermansiaceae bacterium]MCP5550907.1 hypothetical protein [Akkermansiaceae bacterium]